MKQSDPRLFEGILEKALCVLDSAVSDGVESAWLTAADISRTLRDTWRIEVHWRTVGKCLDSNKGTITWRKRDGRRQYAILSAGKALISTSAGQVTVVDPNHAVQHVKSLHEQLSELQGHIYICDPYLDVSTIQHLDSCPLGTTVHLLTHHVNESGLLHQLVSAYSRASRTLHIRCTKAPVIHDRYIIDKQQMLILGTSLNGFGKKLCFIIRAGRDLRATMLRNFQDHWTAAAAWS